MTASQDNQIEMGLKETFDSIAYISKHCGLSKEEALEMLESAYLTTKEPIIEKAVGDDIGRLMSTVIWQWTNDYRYTDDTGEPKVIGVSGEAPSLESLIDDISSKRGITTDTDRVLGTLLDMGVVEVIDEKKLSLKKKHFTNTNREGVATAMLVESVSIFLKTVEENLLQGGGKFFQRVAQNRSCAVRNLGPLKQMTKEAGLNFLETVDGVLMQPAIEGEDTTNVAIGVYYYAKEGENN